MRLLDRHVLKSFLLPFCYCVFGFIAIWLIYDLSDNGGDFLKAQSSFWRVGYYYLTQIPALVVICLPVALMLALLYSLSHLSRSNEILSMLAAGQSVPRILLPLIVAGLVVTGASTALNYTLAPHAEAIKKVLFEQLRGRSVQTALYAQLFRNRAGNRTWYVQRMQKNSNELEGVSIIQQDADGNITRKYYAKRAVYNSANREWTLERGKTVNFDVDGNIAGEEMWVEGSRTIRNWAETPWRVASSNFDAQNLSVQELRDYLHYNADFPVALLAPYRTYLQYRWAVPWMCFAVVFFTAPLGIVYSRRGVLAGVAIAIFIFFGGMFLDKLFLALGKGGRISPAVAAWTPVVLSGLTGLFLLWLRSTNRDVPRLGLKRR